MFARFIFLLAKSVEHKLFTKKIYIMNARFIILIDESDEQKFVQVK